MFSEKYNATVEITLTGGKKQQVHTIESHEVDHTQSQTETGTVGAYKCLIFGGKKSFTGFSDSLIYTQLYVLRAFIQFSQIFLAAVLPRVIKEILMNKFLLSIFVLNTRPSLRPLKDHTG